MEAIRINGFKKIKMKFNIIFIAIILTGWHQDWERQESLEVQWAAVEVESAETESTQVVEVTPVASPTIEPPWTGITPDSSAKSVSESTTSSKTKDTPLPSTSTSSGPWLPRTPDNSPLKIPIEFQSSMSLRPDFSKYWARDSFQASQSLSRLSSSVRLPKERLKLSEVLAYSLLDFWIHI